MPLCDVARAGIINIHCAPLNWCPYNAMLNETMITAKCVWDDISNDDTFLANTAHFGPGREWYWREAANFTAFCLSNISFSEIGQCQNIEFFNGHQPRFDGVHRSLVGNQYIDRALLMPAEKIPGASYIMNRKSCVPNIIVSCANAHHCRALNITKILRHHHHVTKRMP